MKGRQRQDPHRWRGPATAIAKESVSRYYISWRRRVLLVSKDQLRHATIEEAAAATVIAEDANLTAQQSEERKVYQDVTDSVEPPKVRVRKHTP